MIGCKGIEHRQFPAGRDTPLLASISTWNQVKGVILNSLNLAECIMAVQQTCATPRVNLADART